MNAKKKRKKNQRRARKLADQAWEAVDDDHLDLALKLIRRAVDLNPASPVLWNDQGLILTRSGQDELAITAFEAAITLADNYAEPYANLAMVRARQGMTELAVALQRQAVEYAPDSPQYRRTLIAYEALVGRTLQANSDTSSTSVCEPTAAVEALRTEFPGLASRIDRLSWTSIEDQLMRVGHCHLRELLIAVDHPGFAGGDFLFADLPIRRISDANRIPAGLGDAVIFCTRDRIVRVGGVYGLKPVKHGMAEVVSGTRYALGIPFHEYE